jgi:hypothetical protein
MSLCAKKSVSWASDDSLRQVKEYYFYDNITGEALSGQAARNQAKREVLGASWRQTNCIMRLCKSASPYSAEARKLFDIAEKRALALDEPCLFLIGMQWRYCGGRNGRPEEIEIDEQEVCDADDDTSDSSSDESAEGEGAEPEEQLINTDNQKNEAELDWEMLETPTETPVVTEGVSTFVKRTLIGDTTPHTLASLSRQLASTIKNAITIAVIEEEEEQDDEWDECDVPLPDEGISTIEPIDEWQTIGRHEATRARIAAK